MAETDPAMEELLRKLAQDSGGIAEPPAVHVGDVLGRYELLRELGRGGFGVVFAARDTSLGRAVAVKVMARRPGADGRFREQFQREAAAVAKLRHRNIVTVFDWGETADTPYLVLELLEGETLEARLRRAPPSADEALAIAVDIAEGLAHAHRAGILHRDVKPSNVFLCADGVVRLLDFGLARETGGASLLSGAGTPNYMAPEQRTGGSSDARTDVYGFGLVLFELVTGKRVAVELTPTAPGRGDEAAKTTPSLANVLVDVVAKDTPGRLREVVTRCLAVDPADRYADAPAMLQALRGIETERRERPRRLRRWLLAGLGVAAAVGMAIAIAVVRAQAAERSRAVAAITAGVDRVEAELRYAFVEPSHDISGDVARAREELTRLAGSAPSLHPMERGIVEAALGRGYLALGEPSAALAHLRAAGQADARTDVALPLAEALTAAWEEGEESLITAGPTRRADELERLDRLFRQPALALFKQVPSPSPLTLARIAFLEDRLDDAVAIVRAITGGGSSIQRCAAFELGAEILLAKAVRMRGVKDASEVARTLAAAEELSAAALAIGRSDPRLHERACRLQRTRLRCAGRSSGDGPLEVHGRAVCEEAVRVAPQRMATALAAVEFVAERANNFTGPREEMTRRYLLVDESLKAAERIDAGSVDLLATRVELNAAQAGHLRTNGLDAEPLTIQTVADADRLLTLRPDDPRPKAMRVELETQRLRGDIDKGIDPTPRCEKVRALLAGTNDTDGLLRLARAETECGHWALSHGTDPMVAWGRALTAYDQVIARRPTLASAWDELSGVYYEQGHAVRVAGNDSLPVMQRSIAAGEKALELEPSSPALMENLAVTLTETASGGLTLGRDPTELLDRSVALIERAQRQRVTPDSFYNLALAHRVRADWFFNAKRDPQETVNKARAAIERSIALDPNNPALTAVLGDVERWQAKADALHGASPIPQLQRAYAIYDRLRRADPKGWQYTLACMDIGREQSDWERSVHRPFAATARRALALLDGMENPTNDVLTTEAELWLRVAEGDKNHAAAVRAFLLELRLLGEGSRLLDTVPHFIQAARLVAKVPTTEDLPYWLQR